MQISNCRSQIQSVAWNVFRRLTASSSVHTLDEHGVNLFFKACYHCSWLVEWRHRDAAATTRNVMGEGQDAFGVCLAGLHLCLLPPTRCREILLVVVHALLELEDPVLNHPPCSALVQTVTTFLALHLALLQEILHVVPQRNDSV